MNSNMTRQCSHISLSNNAVGDVALCTDCGVVSVVLQYMTLRLEANAFLELEALLRSAREHLVDLAQTQVDEVHTHSWQAEQHVH